MMITHHIYFLFLLFLYTYYVQLINQKQEHRAEPRWCEWHPLVSSTATGSDCRSTHAPCGGLGPGRIVTSCGRSGVRENSTTKPIRKYRTIPMSIDLLRLTGSRGKQYHETDTKVPSEILSGIKPRLTRLGCPCVGILQYKAGQISCYYYLQ